MFPEPSYPIETRKGKRKRSLYCVDCRRGKKRKEEQARAERDRIRQMGPFEGVRLLPIDAPFPEGNRVFASWAGPVNREPWRRSI
jgi:hypothetical protein